VFVLCVRACVGAKLCRCVNEVFLNTGGRTGRSPTPAGASVSVLGGSYPGFTVFPAFVACSFLGFKDFPLDLAHGCLGFKGYHFKTREYSMQVMLPMLKTRVNSVSCLLVLL
jgi:hypothetical protein